MNDQNFNCKRTKIETILKTIQHSSFDELKEQYETVLKPIMNTRNDEPTPVGLVEEMLGFVPRELWSRHNLKILDMCCGLGNWDLVLWNILQEKFQETVQMNELSPERLSIAKQILNTTNTTCQDALTLNVQYDMVVANPPYALLNANGQRASKNHNLVNKFIEKALDLCKEGGYIVFVVPNSWCSPSKRNKLCRRLTSLQFHILNLNECKKWFPKVASSFSYFVVENTPHYQMYLCVSLFKKQKTRDFIKSEARDCIPLHWNNRVKELLNKTIEKEGVECFKIETSSNLHNYTQRHLLSDEKDDDHPFEVVHTFNKKRWASRAHTFQVGWKVLINITGFFKIRITKDVGITQSVAFIRCESKDQAEQFKEQLEKPIYKEVNDLFRFGNFNNLRVLAKLPISI